VTRVQVHFITPDSIEPVPPRGVAAMLERTDGFIWIDLPMIDPAGEELLGECFRIHPRVLEAMRTRNHVPTVHAYDEHFFVVCHAPLLGAAGHVHLLEVDFLVGANYLITVHGPINPKLDVNESLVETRAVLARLEAGRLKATSPMKVAYAVGSAVARRQRDLIGEVAERLPGVEQEVMSSEFRQPEALLEQLFLIRHELTTARTMAAQSHDVMARVVQIVRELPEDDRALVSDLADQFDRVRSVGDGESQFLFGVIDLYQTKVNTKMTVAMERLAVIAAVTLPIAALSSIFGMNMIVYDETHWGLLLTVLLITALMSFWLLRWARRQGWW